MFARMSNVAASPQRTPEHVPLRFVFKATAGAALGAIALVGVAVGFVGADKYSDLAQVVVGVAGGVAGFVFSGRLWRSGRP
jgi:putative flippase GtrA